MKRFRFSPEQERAVITRWEREQLSFNTVAEVSSALLFELKAPKSNKKGKFRKIVVTSNKDLKEREAYIAYGELGNGIVIEANKDGIDRDYDGLVRQMEEGKKSGSLKADKVPHIVYVNGNKGWASEPGYNLIGGQKFPIGGFVHWTTTDGVHYGVTGTKGRNGQKATPLETLIEIAESIE